MGLGFDAVCIFLQRLCGPFGYDFICTFGKMVVVFCELCSDGGGGVDHKIVVFLGVGQAATGSEIQVDL